MNTDTVSSGSGKHSASCYVFNQETLQLAIEAWVELKKLPAVICYLQGETVFTVF